MILFAAHLILIAAQGSNAPVWTEQTFTGGIKVSAPKRMTSNPQKVDDPGMSKVEYWQCVSENCVLLLSVSTLKNPAKSETSALFSASTAGFSAGKDVAITGMKDLLVQGWPGIAVTVRQPDGIIGVTRTFRSKEFLIQGCGFYAMDIKRPPEVDKFLDSFRFPTDGEAKAAGPAMTRFPLGTSGLTALFPREPENHESQVGKGASQGPMYVYSSDYGMRSFQVAYRDVPFPKPPTHEEMDVARVAIAEDIIASFRGKKVSQKDDKIGTDQGLLVDFAIGNEATGTVLVYMRGNRMVTLVIMGPRAYVDSKTVDLFIHSVEWKQ